MKPIFTQSSYQFTLTLVVILVSLLAGLGLLVWGTSPFAYLLNHNGAAVRGWPDALFVLGWLLMCVAMMLPTALPLLAAVERLTLQRADTRRLTFISALSFLGIWLSAGVVVRFGDILLHTLMHHISWLADHPNQVGSTLLSIAGIYLILPIAQKCVDACQSPMGFIARAWTGRPNVRTQVARIGLEYGVSCFGCCWPLMAVMCALGMANPLWMLSFTLLMILQKHKRFGRLVTTVSGLVLLAVAVVMFHGTSSIPHTEHIHTH
jgi:predicted metal-binding membrane protein